MTKKQSRNTKISSDSIIAGWREWVSLPDLGIEHVKAKLDTGARTSALHAYDIEIVKRGGKDWVHFKVHPLQRNRLVVVKCQAELMGMRKVRSSSGHTSVRPVIETQLGFGNLDWKIQMTLTDRDAMGFRMLLGRQGMPANLLVSASHSFLFGRNYSSEKGS